MSEYDDDPFAGLDPVTADGPPDHSPEQPGGPPSDAPEDMVERLCRAAQQPLNDHGNGQRFVTHFGDDVMSVPRVGWFAWSGSHWRKDEDQLAVRRQAQRLSDLILREIPHLPMTQAEQAAMADRADVSSRLRELLAIPKGDRSEEQAREVAGLQQRSDAISEVEKRLRDRRSRHRSFANTTGNSARIDNAMKEAGVELAVAFDDLDAEPLVVNTESHVLRFAVTDASADGGGRVCDIAPEPHRREQRLTKIMGAGYDPDAGHDAFDAFLERIQPDREIREFLKRWFGLSMSGLPMQRLVFLYGAGANGKSVLVDTIARIMGGYAATARIESLTGSNRRGGGDATPDLIPLMGARMVRTSEPDEGQRLQEGLIKELTGGEPLQVRALHSDFVEVRPIFKLTMSGNHKPEIRGTDDGIWRRVLLVPFDVQIPEAERDPELVDKLFAERAGILNWLIEGLMEVLEGGLAPPAAVTEATREYRDESDPIGMFLTACCVITGDPGDVITSKVLGDAFTLHMMERGMSPWKPTTFSRQLSAKARAWRHPETGKQFAKGKASISQYVGLRFTDAFRRRFDDAPKDSSGKPLAAQSGDAPYPDTDFTGG